jgi:hypothetical protein
MMRARPNPRQTGCCGGIHLIHLLGILTPALVQRLPNLSLLGNHIQVFQPVSYEETDAVWYGTEIDDVDGSIGEDALNDINALRMRTQEGFPNFGEVDSVGAIFPEQ